MASDEIRELYSWHRVVLARSESATTRTLLTRGVLPRTLGLPRFGWEHVAVVAFAIDDQPFPMTMVQAGEEQRYPLPTTDRNAKRILSVSWINKTARACQFSFFLSPEVLAGLPGTMRPPAPALPQALVPDEAVARTMQRRKWLEPPSELETVIAQSFGIPWEICRHIVRQVAGRNGLEPEAMLSFFGPDGHSTIEPEWLDAVMKRALETGLDPGQLQFAQVMYGIAKTISERKEFVELLAEAQSGTGDFTSRHAPDEFKVTSVVHPRAMEVPASYADLVALAVPFEIGAAYLQVVLKNVSDARGISPNDLVALLKQPGVIMRARDDVRGELDDHLAKAFVDGSELPVGSDLDRYRNASEEARPALYAQLLAVRAIDRLVRPTSPMASQSVVIGDVQ